MFAVLSMTACAGETSTANPTAATTTTTSTMDAREASTTTATMAPATTTTMDEEGLAARQEALERVHAFFEAVNARQVDELAEVLGVPLSESRRRHFEFHSILKSAGFIWKVESCEIASAFGSIIKVNCLMHNENPVFVATEASDVIAPFTILGEELREESWKPLDVGFDAPLGVFVDYLTLFTDQYPLCDPGEIVGEFSEHLGVARVPECAEVIVEHMDAMVAWVEAGTPPP